MTQRLPDAAFPMASREDWLALVDKALKGAAFDEALVSRTHDGLAVGPLYTAADAPGHREMPGRAPYTRGAEAGGNGWRACQIVEHPDPAAANAALREDIAGGATAVGILWAADDGAPGVLVRTPGDLATLLDGIDPGTTPIHLDAGAAAPAAAALLLGLVEDRGIPGSAVCGTLGLDPLGRLAADGRIDGGEQAALATAADFAVRAAAFPGLRPIGVDTRAWHLAGASEAQEIAVAIATGVAYLRALEAAGMEVAQAAGRIAFTMTTDADFFASVAKLRAARLLWAKATAASGAAAAMSLTVETAERMMTVRDPWVNALRTTVACFAAGAAGAQTVAVRPHSSAAGLADGFARRIARNTQIILQEESGLGRVSDPAGGSWYVERLTDELAAAGWRLFQEIEREGGIAASLAGGRVQGRVAAVAAARARNIATVSEPLTGTSAYATVDEAPVEVAQVDLVAMREAAQVRTQAWIAARTAAVLPEALPEPGSGKLAGALIDAARAGATVAEIMAAVARAGSDTAATVTPLPRQRLAEPFERLRARADAHLAATGRRPTVFLASLETPAAFTKRVRLARNALAAGGIAAVASPPCASVQQAVDAWRDSGLAAAVLCSSDAVYGEMAAETARALTAAGAAPVWLAGDPGAARADYEAAGIGAFIHDGCDLVALLADLLGKLGVEGA